VGLRDIIDVTDFSFFRLMTCPHDRGRVQEVLVPTALAHGWVLLDDWTE
jgi:hypothetical protein